MKKVLVEWWLFSRRENTELSLITCDIDNLISATDKALYRAEDSGKNCVRE